MAALKPYLFHAFITCAPRIIIAVSGGSDSMALMDLYRLARAETPLLPEPLIVTVDHGLRKTFGPEAALVEAACVKYNLPWRLARWAGDKPKTGIMAAARLARYKLLADAAQSVSADVILTGHTADDQIETAAMRARRGAASVMESQVLFERRAIISRPLLSLSRAALRTHLYTQKIEFVDDPTNVDVRFERGAIRLLDPAQKLQLPEQSLVDRKDLALRAADFLTGHVQRSEGSLIVKRPKRREYDAEIFALRYLAACLGGSNYPSAMSTGVKLVDLLNDGSNGAAFTVEQSRFVRTETGLSISRDPRHSAKAMFAGKVQPFEAFCATSLIPLANALAYILGASHFILPDQAAI
jgi:tRNA(Ile)-lysidine synthase